MDTNLDKLEDLSPQQMLENAFQSLYEKHSIEETLRVIEEHRLIMQQLNWCNKFIEAFSFVSKYNAKIKLRTHSDYDVKHFQKDKYYVKLFTERYFPRIRYIDDYVLEIHAPKSEAGKCHCIETLYFGASCTHLDLTLPEIAERISKGLAKINAEKDCRPI